VPCSHPTPPLPARRYGAVLQEKQEFPETGVQFLARMKVKNALLGLDAHGEPLAGRAGPVHSSVELVNPMHAAPTPTAGEGKGA